MSEASIQKCLVLLHDYLGPNTKKTWLWLHKHTPICQWNSLPESPMIIMIRPGTELPGDNAGGHGRYQLVQVLLQYQGLSQAHYPLIFWVKHFIYFVFVDILIKHLKDIFYLSLAKHNTSSYQRERGQWVVYYLVPKVLW